jgi:hypothetical protein
VRLPIGTGGVAKARVLAAILGQVSATPSSLSGGFPGMRMRQTIRAGAFDDKGMLLPGVTPSVANDGWAFPDTVTSGQDGSAVFSWVGAGVPRAGTPAVTVSLAAVSRTVDVVTTSTNPPTLPLRALNIFIDIDHPRPDRLPSRCGPA